MKHIGIIKTKPKKTHQKLPHIRDGYVRTITIKRYKKELRYGY